MQSPYGSSADKPYTGQALCKRIEACRNSRASPEVVQYDDNERRARCLQDLKHLRGGGSNALLQALVGFAQERLVL